MLLQRFSSVWNRKLEAASGATQGKRGKEAKAAKDSRRTYAAASRLIKSGEERSASTAPEFIFSIRVLLCFLSLLPCFPAVNKADDE